MSEDFCSLAELETPFENLNVKKMNQKPARTLTYTTLSISLLTVMAGAAIAPALGIIREHFKDLDSLLVQLIVSIPALFIIITNLCFTTLCRWMKTRTLAMVGLTLYVVSGAGAFFVDNIWGLLCLRALMCVSVGMVMPLSTGLLAYYFPPEEQAHLMGLSAAMNQMGGVVATFLAGLLAGISWNCAFLVYLLGLIALVLVALFLPDERLVSRGSGFSLRLLRRFHPSVTGMLLVMLLFFIYPTNFAITASANPTLDSRSITLVMVGLDVIAFLVGLGFGGLMRTFRVQMKYFAPLGFIAGYVCLSAGTDWVWLLSGSALIGIANGVGVPYLNTIASIKGGKDAATTVMPLISASLYLGQFLSPLLVNPAARLVGGGLTAPYLVGVLLGVIYLVQTFLTREFQALPPKH